jgi:NTE family protein
VSEPEPMARVGAVLSGGGARGAYEAGVLAGITDVLGAGASGPATFQVVSGTSVGAINGAWLAANAHRADHDTGGLLKLWRSLSLSQHVKLDLRALMGGRRDADRYGRSLLDPGALEKLVQERIAWPRLHDNIERGYLRALVVAALHIGSGMTTLFTELAPGTGFIPTDHPRRVSRLTRIDARHVLASSAIPVLFPSRRVDGAFFADGSLRFNTPISPALRAGADKLVVVTLEPETANMPSPRAHPSAEEQYPSLVFLAGKLLNALLLDPVSDDLEVLDQLNTAVHAVERSLDRPSRARLDAAVREVRGRPYRAIDTLRLSPSRNIGMLAGEHLREGGGVGRPLSRFLLQRAAHEGATWEADLASYLLFDEAWAERLIELGVNDVRLARDRVRRFFEQDTGQA